MSPFTKACDLLAILLFTLSIILWHLNLADLVYNVSLDLAAILLVLLGAIQMLTEARQSSEEAKL